MKLTRDVRAALAAAGVDVPAPRTGDGRPPVPERLFQIAVTEFASLHGWTVYHVPDSRRATSAGFPDLTLARAGEGVVFAELKREGKRPRASQVWWLDRLRESGVRVFVWDVTCWPEIQAVLGRPARET